MRDWRMYEIVDITVYGEDCLELDRKHSQAAFLLFG